MIEKLKKDNKLAGNKGSNGDIAKTKDVIGGKIGFIKFCKTKAF